jgi:hypothetical protein
MFYPAVGSDEKGSMAWVNLESREITSFNPIKSKSPRCDEIHPSIAEYI